MNFFRVAASSSGSLFFHCKLEVKVRSGHGSSRDFRHHAHNFTPLPLPAVRYPKFNKRPA